MNLGSNQIATPLGSTFANAPLLKSLDLHNNKYSGFVPSSMFDNLPLLTYIDLSNNQLSVCAGF